MHMQDKENLSDLSIGQVKHTDEVIALLLSALLHYMISPSSIS